MTLGTQCVEYHLRWSDERFTFGNGKADFAIDDVCDHDVPASGNEIIAMLMGSTSELEKCYTRGSIARREP